MTTTDDFIGALQILIGSMNGGTPTIYFATIDPNYTSGQPSLIFDGEINLTIKQYPRLATYTPVANDRVAVITAGHGALILGKVI
jgi:hypothetical protein